MGSGTPGHEAIEPFESAAHGRDSRPEAEARKAHQEQAQSEPQRQREAKERRRVRRQADTLNHQATGRIDPGRDRRQHTLATLARWGGRRAADSSRTARGGEQKAQAGLTGKPARLLGAALDRAGAMAAKLIDKAADAIDRLFGARRDARKTVEPARPAPQPAPESALFSQWRDHGSPLAEAIRGQDAPAPAPEQTAQPEPERAAQPRDPEAEHRADIERQKREDIERQRRQARERWEQSLRSRDDDDPRPRGGRR